MWNYAFALLLIAHFCIILSLVVADFCRISQSSEMNLYTVADFCRISPSSEMNLHTVADFCRISPSSEMNPHTCDDACVTCFTCLSTC